jgi:transcriptional regulator
MYSPPAFRLEDKDTLFAAIRDSRLANFVTATAEGLMASPLPLFLDESEGELGVLYGHLARANLQARMPPVGDALAIFMGPDAYITPAWYRTKHETQKVVPTWNYVSVQASGPVEFFGDTPRLLEVVTRLTELHEEPRPSPWAVSDAPNDYIQSQLRGIVGFRMVIDRLDGKRKMSQNKNEADCKGVVKGLAASDRLTDRFVAQVMSLDD